MEIIVLVLGNACSVPRDGVLHVSGNEGPYPEELAKLFERWHEIKMIEKMEGIVPGARVETVAAKVQKKE
jgi:hypothetical protein